MKAEDREELQQNDLAGWMYRLPFFLRAYGSYILLGIALVILGWRLWDWHKNNVAIELQRAWSSLSEAIQTNSNDPPSRLQAIITATDNHAVQAFAYAKLGKFYLDFLTAGAPPDGLQGVKASADEAAKDARDAFNKVIADFSDQTLALAEARLGLAALAENQLQWDEARKQYEAILDKSGPLANSAFADIARTRLANLDNWSKPALIVNSPDTENPVTPAAQPATSPADAGKHALDNLIITGPPVATTSPAPAASRPATAP